MKKVLFQYMCVLFITTRTKNQINLRYVAVNGNITNAIPHQRLRGSALCLYVLDRRCWVWTLVALIDLPVRRFPFFFDAYIVSRPEKKMLEVPISLSQIIGSNKLFHTSSEYKYLLNTEFTLEIFATKRKYKKNISFRFKYM